MKKFFGKIGETLIIAALAVCFAFAADAGTVNTVCGVECQQSQRGIAFAQDVGTLGGLTGQVWVPAPFVLAQFQGSPESPALNPIAPGATPITVAMPKQSGGIINIGQAFGDVLQPYVDAAVQTLIAALIGWVVLLVKQKFNVDIDKKHSDELTKFLQNRASSLIADGAVKMDGITVKVDNQRLADAANAALSSVPDAVKRFGLTPEVLSAKIVDAIPQVPAGAAIVAQAHVDAPPITAKEIADAAPTPEPTPTGKPA